MIAKYRFSIVYLLCILFSLNLNAQISKDTSIEKKIKSIYKELNQGVSSLARDQAQTFLIDNPTLDCLQKGRLNKIIAMSFRNERNMQASIDWINEKVLKIWTNCDSLPKRYLVEPNVVLAELFGQLNDYPLAIETIKKVFALYKNGNGKGAKYEVRANLVAGHAYSILGDQLLAEKYFDKAEVIIEDIKSEGLQIVLRHLLINNRSIHFMDYGKFANALIDFEEGLELTKKIYSEEYLKNNFNDELSMRNNMTMCYIQMGKYDQAQAQIDIIKSKENEIINDNHKAEYLINYSTLALRKGNINLATKLINSNELFFSKLNLSYAARVNLIQAIASKNQENEHVTDAHYAQAINSLVLNESIDINEEGVALANAKIYNYEVMYDILKSYYQWKKSTYERLNTETSLSQVINVFEELDYLITSSRSNYLSELSRINQLGNNYNIYEDIIALLANSRDQKNKKLAMFYCLKNKGNEINTNLERKNMLRSSIDEKLQVKIENFENELRKLEYQLAIISSEKEKDSLNSSYLLKVNEYADFKKSVSSSKSNTNLFQNDASVDLSIAKLQDKLSKSEMLIEIFYGENQIFIFSLYQSSCRVHSVTRTKEFDDTVDKMSQILINEGDLNHYKGLSKELYKNLFSPVLNNIEPKVEKIFIVPDGKLYRLPFEAMWDGSEYNIEKFTTTLLFNSEMLINDHLDKYDHSYLGFGTTYSNGLNKKLEEEYKLKDVKLAQLQNAESEILQSQKLFKGEANLGKESSLQRFMTNSHSSKGIIHFALHGMIIDEYSSAIIFDDRNNDFLLTSNQVYSLKLDNYLSILSTCYSADGKVYAGDGVHSLTRSFLFAGSSNIISSIWAASDQANEQIITSFFTKVKSGDHLPEALTSAKRTYLKNASPALKHPSYWANLVLVGVGKNSSSTLPLWTWFLFAIIAVSIFYLILRKK